MFFSLSPELIITQQTTHLAQGMFFLKLFTNDYKTTMYPVGGHVPP